jgi:hypothetical protein
VTLFLIAYALTVSGFLIWMTVARDRPALSLIDPDHPSMSDMAMLRQRSA